MARRILTGLTLTGVSLMLAGAALGQTTSPGSSSGAPGSGTGPTIPRPVPAQPGTGVPAPPGRPGPGAPQAPPGMNQAPPGTPTQPGTITPGTTQLPPGSTAPTPGTQATPGTITPGTPIPQVSTPGAPGSGASSIPSAGTDTMGQIRSAQQALQGSGMNPGAIDGIMGPRTQQAVRDYQKQQNLPQTGQLDAATLQKLGVPSM